MPNPLTIEDETALRAAIAADVATIALLGNVYTRRRLITGRADFIKKLGKYPGPTFEVRFFEIDLVEVEDSDEGPEDCPTAILTYNFHLFHEFNDGRPDGSNSDHDFNNALLQLRAMFLSRREYTPESNAGSLPRGKAQTQLMTSAQFAQFGNDDLIDCVGHSKDLTLKVYFYV